MSESEPAAREPRTTKGLALRGALRKSRVMPDLEVDWQAWIVAIEDEAALAAADKPTPEPAAFPDHTHRWEERSQETLDAEYGQTGAVLGRWICRACWTETDVEPDSLAATHTAPDETLRTALQALTNEFLRESIPRGTTAQAYRRAIVRRLDAALAERAP